MASAIYLRKSRAEEQAEPADVLARHRQTLLECAAHREIPVTEVYEEVISGESLYARPEMLRLLQAVQAGAYEAVLCMDIDRLGRGGMSDQGLILDAFRLSGTLIITPDKTYDLSDDADEELTEFKAFMARREYKLIRKRMRRGLLQTVREGGYVPNAPFGYKKCMRGKLPSLETVGEEANLIRLIFERYRSGVGAAGIAAELNSLGSHPRRGSSWSRNTVREILRNPTYMGKIAWNRVCHRRSPQDARSHAVSMPPEAWLMADGLHPAIVSPEEWWEAQSIRESRRVPSQSGGILNNPLAGLVRCAACGHHMQLQSPSGGTAYLLCGTKGCCAGAQFRFVESAVLDSLEEELKTLRLDMVPVTGGEPDRISQAADCVSRSLDGIQRRILRLHELLEDGTYDRETFASRRAAAEAERTTLLATLASLQAELDRVLRPADNRVARPRNALELYPMLDASGKNRLLKALVNSIDYWKPKKTKPHAFALRIHLRVSSAGQNL